MNIHKHLIKLNNRLERTWSNVDFGSNQIQLQAGWYICRLVIAGAVDHTPRIVVTNQHGNDIDRPLVGAHSGQNRMLIYLPGGNLKAYSSSIEFQSMARVSTLEARFRVLKICWRYLLDFKSPKALFKVLAIQFQDPIELSGNLLSFYEPAANADHYLEEIHRWRKYRGFGKQLAWLGRGIKIGLVIEDAAQRNKLNELLVQPDSIVEAGQPLPAGIDYWIPLAVTEHLREPSLLIFKRAIRKAAVRPKLIYSDHDYSNSDESRPFLHPVFKPAPSRVYLHCFNYIGFASAFTDELVRSVGTAAIMDEVIQYRLALDAFSDTDRVLNISETLFLSDRQTTLHTPQPPTENTDWQHIKWLRRKDYNVLVADPAWAEEQPSVDLVIPTRDGMSVLRPCVDSILAKTEYQNFKLFIVDNGSELPETHDYFRQIQQDDRVSVLEYPGEFNYSAINNFAVSHGKSEYVALINNDIEVISGDWLTQMMVWAVQPEVGIVGAKLLFGNGQVQHAGVTIGMGNAAGHIHKLEEGDAPGYQLRCLATQNMMAVTAACMVTPRGLFEELGGLDDKTLKVAYNDVDYCLRVEAQGHQIIWTPEACLYHHESVSRGDDMSDKHIERYFRELEVFQTRWRSKGFVDKYYSKHLRISDEGVYPQVERREDDELILVGQADGEP